MPNTPEIWRNEFQANTVSFGTQNDSTIIQLTNGNIVVLWTSDIDLGAGSPNGTDIIGQIYDPLGNAIGNEFRANGPGYADFDEGEFSAAALDDGRFVVVFEDTRFGDTVHIDATEWSTDANGVTTSNSRTIQNTGPAGDQVGGPSVAGNTVDGSYTVAYQYFDDSASLTSTRIRHVDSSGTLGPVNTSSGTSSTFNENVEIARLSNNNYVVVYQADGADDGIIFRLLNSSGVPGTGGFVANTDTNGENDRDATVIGLENGGFVVAWVNDDADTDIQFQRYNNAGAEQGGVVAVNSAGGSDDNNEPHLIALADGGFVVVYDDDTANVIRAQRYSATGVAVGDERTITQSGQENDPSGIGLADGRFITGWTTTQGGPGEVRNIEIEFYDTRDNANGLGAYSPEEWQIGTVGSDTFTADGNTEFVHGWDGNDSITDGFGTEEIFGDSGNDTIFVTSSISADAFHGGSGTDTIDWSGSGEIGATFDLANGTATDSDANQEVMTGFERLRGTENADTILGTNGANVLIGNGGNDTIIGGNGNDTIDGGLGFDMIDGGLGDDYLIGSLQADTMDGGSGIDTADFSGATNNQTMNLVTNVNIGGFVHNDTLISIENVIGSATNGDTITGSSGDNIINGLGADDVLRGHHGDDTLSGGANNDFLFGGTGADVLNGGAGLDWAMYSGLTTGVTVNLSTGMGFGGDAAGDTYISIERVRGSAVDDFLFGDVADNRLLGDGGNDDLRGGLGRDDLRGGDDNDTLNGGAGNDALRGDGGADIFVYGNNYQHDFVVDFEDDIDTLQINDNLYGGGLTAQQVVDTYMTMENPNRFYFDFGDGDILHVLTTAPLAISDFYDDVVTI